MKLYQRIERLSPGYTPEMTQQWSLDQIHSARDNGCEVAGYWWPYNTQDVREGLRDILDLEARSGVSVVMDPFADIETYTDGSIPTREQLDDILDEYARQAYDPGFYSSVEMWRRVGSPRYAGVRGWGAGGPRYKTGGDWPLSLDGAPAFGGLSIMGWQWTSNPLDLDIFRL